jgi:uridine phosphorylase
MIYNLTSSDFEPFVFEADVGARRIVVVTRCVWGGPQAAILIEELAALGVRTIVGYGVAGSLHPQELPQGTFVVAETALPTDGTTRAYGATSIQSADPGLLEAAISAGKKVGCPLTRVRAATVDALYRETPSLIQDIRDQGGQIVQMECSPLYAVSAACGVRSVWIGYVTDCLSDGSWTDWYRPLTDANENAIRICRGVLESL